MILSYPFPERAVDLRVPKRDRRVIAKVMMDAAEKPKTEALAEPGQGLDEV